MSAKLSTAKLSTAGLVRDSLPWGLARRGWYRILEEASPETFCAWNSRFPGRTVVTAETDLVIEGYPSAANSLVREVLYRTSPGIRIASHLHSPAHVLRAVELGIPTLVLLRPPVESVSSLLARYPERRLDPRGELARYRRFYSTVLRSSGRVALARFEETVGSLSSVIESVNERFGTSFATCDDSDSGFFDEVFATLDYWSEKVSGDRFEVVTPRPSPARAQALADTRRMVEGAGRTRLTRCRQLHDRLAAIAAVRREAALDGPGNGL